MPQNPRLGLRGAELRPLPSPEHIATKSLPITSWSEPLYRICRSEHDPLYFGKNTRNRFDCPWGEYGVLYAAESPEGAFIETCIRDRPGGNLFVLSFFQERKLTRLSASSPLRLVDLAGPGLSILGVDNRLATGNYRTAQRWSRAFWLHPDCPDGILYCSRFNPSLHCVALFDRAGARLSPIDCGALADPRNVRFLGEMLDRYELTL
jgi:RES domain